MCGCSVLTSAKETDLWLDLPYQFSIWRSTCVTRCKLVSLLSGIAICALTSCHWLWSTLDRVFNICWGYLQFMSSFGSLLADAQLNQPQCFSQVFITQMVEFCEPPENYTIAHWYGVNIMKLKIAVLLFYCQHWATIAYIEATSVPYNAHEKWFNVIVYAYTRNSYFFHFILVELWIPMSPVSPCSQSRNCVFLTAAMVMFFWHHKWLMRKCRKYDNFPPSPVFFSDTRTDL